MVSALRVTLFTTVYSLVVCFVASTLSSPPPPTSLPAQLRLSRSLLGSSSTLVVLLTTLTLQLMAPSTSLLTLRTLSSRSPLVVASLPLLLVTSSLWISLAPHLHSCLRLLTMCCTSLHLVVLQPLSTAPCLRLVRS